MALQVIGAGLGRTGTMTLKTALQMLGFGPCHHMIEVFANPATQMPFWDKASRGEAVDWDMIFAGYCASVDWPSAHYYQALAAHFPEAKVILSRRDPDHWCDSMEATILKAMAMHAQVPDHPMRFIYRIIAEQTLGGDMSRGHLKAAFEAHNAAVVATIPPERLLVFEAADGWVPLCDFLGVPVPDTAFPRTNSREDFWNLAPPGPNSIRRPTAGDPPGSSGQI